jgi:cell division protein FtsQ
MRLLPSRLVVSLVERTPVAFVLIGTKTSLIDANGVIMGPAASRQNKYRFPVLRGLRENGSVGERAEGMKTYNRLMRELESGDSEGQHLTNQLSEIDVSDPEDVKATVCDDSGTVLVHLGDSDFLQRYKLYAAHIGEWRRQYHNVQGVDLRWEGQIIVNPDGEHGAQPKRAAAARRIDPSKPDFAQKTQPGNRYKRQNREGSKK